MKKRIAAVCLMVMLMASCSFTFMGCDFSDLCGGQSTDTVLKTL